MLYDQTQLTSELKRILDSFQIEIKKLKTGKASYDLLESISVEAYGAMNKLSGVGQIQVEDAVNAKITIWDKNILPNVEKALRESNIGASVVVEKDGIRLKFNPITEEDRKILVKNLNLILEDYRVRTRKVRHDFIKSIENLDKVSEDDKDRDVKQIQKMIDDTITKLEELSKGKESDLLKL